ncbi:cell division protein FtsK [Streptosporangium saharense]|uniref:S-DNA-T family DNA segregation ATPase FtsK/SpoIIIE n=1 Tax=Streptosporangium saharense TaxID=1706840 RepID=A0A7W7QPI7_9ACTN|nr:cell division protein FtsK [Streptosporangium saharense]MBB4917410.1 S-DNA-T family DNA segregation ATPase FtsK/SpoIIIE [Streptosporangium saharense]
MTLHHTPDPLPEGGDSMGELVRFPRRDNGDGAAPLEGTVVPRALPDAPDDSQAAPLVRLLGQAVEHAARVRADERTVRLTRGALGVTVTIGQGGHSWLVRAWDALTLGAYRRQIRAAEAMGDRAALSEWMDRKAQAADRRHARLAALPGLALGLAKVAGGGVAATGVVLLGTSTLVWATGAGEFLTVPKAAGTVLRWVFDAVAFGLSPALTVAPIALVWAAWREGRRRGNAPSWLATAADADLDISIDETTIARALEALRIPQITTYLKQGLPLQYLTTARRDGRGTHAVLRLPAGVTAEQLTKRRAALATGLYRAAKEVWPTTGSEAGILDLWVADKGALAEGAGPYPLLTEGVVDVFKGVPLGKTLRGDPIMAPLMERNTITGGMPGQGKSSSARVILAGASLDPTAEIRIGVPDSNFDFELFRPRCSRYVMGAEDDKIAEILDDLRELDAEVQQRGELLIQHQEPAVTRKLADAGIGLHPLFYLLEEAHIAIQHKTYGKEIAELLIRIVKLGRKRGIHLLVSTQAPTKDSMPRDVTRNCSNGIAFAVGDHVANDALLGQGAYSAGHRATELIPGVDKGTAVCKGLTGERSDIVQVYFISIAKGRDELTPIIERSMEAIAKRGTGVPGTTRPARQAEPDRDLLADLAAVLGELTVPAADLPPLLAAHAPQWVPYRSLTGKALREQLAELGVKVPSTGNKWPVSPELVRQALADRQDADAAS